MIKRIINNKLIIEIDEHYSFEELSDSNRDWSASSSSGTDSSYSRWRVMLSVNKSSRSVKIISMHMIIYVN